MRLFLERSQTNKAAEHLIENFRNDQLIGPTYELRYVDYELAYFRNQQVRFNCPEMARNHLTFANQFENNVIHPGSAHGIRQTTRCPVTAASRSVGVWNFSRVDGERVTL